MPNDHRPLIESIYEAIQKQDFKHAVGCCLRLSRLFNDFVTTGIFLQELSSDRKSHIETLSADMSGRSREDMLFVWKIAQRRWFDERSADQSPDVDPDSPNIFVGSIGEIDESIAKCRAVIDELGAGGAGSQMPATFLGDVLNEKVECMNHIATLIMIRERIGVRCLNYAIQAEKQLSVQTQSQEFVWSMQNDVNNFFKARCEDVYAKLVRATELCASERSEDMALSLTVIRRTLEAAADHLYPPVQGEQMCEDGEKRELGKGQHLNRLKEFIRTEFRKCTARDLLGAELEYLDTFLSRLNQLACKGVHGNVTRSEARQGLLGLYTFLSNVVAWLERAPADAPKQHPG